MNSSWKPTKLASVLEPVTRSVTVDPSLEYDLLGIRLDGAGPFLRETKFGSNIAARTLNKVAAGDFIYSRLFAWRGAFGVIDESLAECYVSNEFPTFRANNKKIDLEFLRLWFRLPSTLIQVEADCTGSTPLTRNRFKEEFFLNLEIPLPSLPEQRQIVAKIDNIASKAEEGRNLRQKALEEVKFLYDSVIVSIFEEGESYGWEKGVLGDYVIDCCYGTSEKTNSDGLGIPIIRMGNIQNGRLILSDLKHLFLSESNAHKLLLKKGDILVNRTNSAELVGKCAVFQEVGKYAFASYIIRLRLDKTKADSKLVAMYINSPMGRSYMFKERKQMTGQANINSKKLKALPIALPKLDEQWHIVAYLDKLHIKIDRLNQLQEKTAAELDALLPSILDKAFKGELK